ncbi:hypothetical protein Q2T41_08790 [Maribacter confluentis]|uniref:Uncharacterized protein n=1 Tax=Maribacter confluentis TaxID=1656093 RepID=A0ABT8RPA7_9FLAO|nr:hypothetical protein [Maribacter confluentis]MDO1512749.1 hypothetical protein [Maribacter confluentis]
MVYKFLSFAFFIFIASCSNTDDTVKEDCNENTVCTQNFVTIGVTVKDASGVNVPLDRFKVVDTKTDEDITLVQNQEEFEDYAKDGYYPIFSDAYRLDYQNQTTTIAFIGYNADKEIVNEEFTVGADCCHVLLISGNTDIIID